MEQIKLWDKTPLYDETIDQPEPYLVPYLVGRQANHGAVIVVPGGGYAHLADDHEGHQFAQWFNYLGYHAFVLYYRRKPYRAPVPQMDIARAVRYVRHHAESLGVDPENIGTIGFSAGGHLVSTLVTRFDNGIEGDEVDAESSRPDFAMLMYPVITADETYSNKGSFQNLLGDKYGDPETMAYWSTEKHVTPDCPPIFLAHAADDNAVPVENSFRFLSACKENRVPVELHVYPEGGHGFGLGRDFAHTFEWNHDCEKWLKIYG